QGAKTAALLRTSNAFHSPLMKQVAEEWAAIVARAPMVAPSIAIAKNLAGTVVHTEREVREAATAQLVEPVLWASCLRTLAANGAELLVECGDSHVLTAFARRTTPDVAVLSGSGPRPFQALE